MLKRPGMLKSKGWEETGFTRPQSLSVMDPQGKPWIGLVQCPVRSSLDVSCPIPDPAAQVGGGRPLSTYISSAAHQLFSCPGSRSLPARKFPEFLCHEVSLLPSWDTESGALGRALWALGQICLRVIVTLKQEEPVREYSPCCS